MPEQARARARSGDGAERCASSPRSTSRVMRTTIPPAAARSQSFPSPNRDSQGEWRRRESNPRPRPLGKGVYKRSSGLRFARWLPPNRPPAGLARLWCPGRRQRRSAGRRARWLMPADPPAGRRGRHATALVRQRVRDQTPHFQLVQGINEAAWNLGLQPSPVADRVETWSPPGRPTNDSGERAFGQADADPDGTAAEIAAQRRTARSRSRRARSIWRRASRSAMAWRLSAPSLPRASPISALTRPSTK